jgi:hypothetical protein
MSDVSTMTACQAEAWCIEPIYRDLKIPQTIARVNKCMGSKNAKAIEGAMTVLQVLGFNFADTAKLRPTREECQRAALNLIAEINGRISKSDFPRIEAALSQFGFSFLRPDEETVGWCWAGQCGRRLRFESPVALAPSPQGAKP